MTQNLETIAGREGRSPQHPLFGVSLRNWVRLISSNGGIDSKYLGKAAFVTITSLGTAPARVMFRLRYSGTIQNTTIQNPPVFIIGHWRTGTTYLHELMSQDPQFCYVSLWNTLLPDSFLVFEQMKPFLARFLPSKRPMDEIRVDMDGPYEDEAGLAVLLPWSFFHCLHFPRNAEEQYQKAILFQGLTSEDIDQWKERYLTFIKTVTFANQGKRLLSKNPPNTARLSALLELFPQAKFIHIYRNPYKVYLSTKKMRHNVLKQLALQQTTEEDLEWHVIHDYTRLMDAFFEQKDKIPKGQLVELRYEDLIKDPLGQVKQIYRQLQLPGFEQAVPELQKYLDRQAKYKTNVYSLDATTINNVKENWSSTIDRWGYSPPKR
ncbi:MAG TPA: sulfotransferase [Candidatus Thermoplasmatota archaeon]|nr:sulfotransferase [Candidatus Thermoplasmatota archaeon]